MVGCRSRLDHAKLKPGTRVALDMTTLTIMRILPREVCLTKFLRIVSGDLLINFFKIG